MAPAAKMIDDLPQFHVTTIKKIETHEAGFELSVVFDEMTGVNEGSLPPIGTDGTIKSGWNHAHCELCDRHIEPENYGYVDASDHWLGGTCYDKYVVNHDLSFIAP